MKPGTITKQTDGYQVQFDRLLNHSILNVWNAITRSEMLKEWFTDIEMDFRPGGKITFRFRDKDKTASYGEIVEISEPNRFVYTWEGELATWELFAEGSDKCRLRLTYQKLPVDYAANAPAGFHILLDRLEKALSGERTYYEFGAEENDREGKKLQVSYGAQLFSSYPELERFRPIRVERVVNAPAQKVWNALTRKEEMKEWYFDLDEFKPEVGFVFYFRGQGHKGEQYVHRCEITECVPLHRLQYSWEYEGIGGYSLVTFELTDEGGTTRVTLTHQGIETFPKDNPDFAKESFNGGWTELITVLLPKYVEAK